MTPPNLTASRASHAPRWRPGAAVLLLALALGSLLPPELVHAQEYTASRKFGRGLAGMTVGFLEIPGNVVQETRNHGALYGMTLGLAMGLGRCVTRELVGVYEFLTAPFEAPSGFTPILDPEFPWQYFDAGGSGTAGIEGDLRGIPGTTLSRRDGGVVVTFAGELLFSTASAILSPEARASLDRVALALRDHPRVTATVTGHTDNTGSEETNRQLSTARAEAVARYLASRGLDRSRIVTRGFGATTPVASNDTAAGRRLNRRVEVVLR